MNKVTKNILYLLAVAALLALPVCDNLVFLDRILKGRKIQVQNPQYIVEKVIDGDTLKLTNGETVQLIGVNAPEFIDPGIDLTAYDPGEEERRDMLELGVNIAQLAEMGQEARGFVRSFIGKGQIVRLVFDVGKKNEHGRLLAYVYHRTGAPAPKGQHRWFYVEHMEREEAANYMYNFLNASIVKAGYATAISMPPNVKHADLFQELYEEAREEERGLWREDSIIPTFEGNVWTVREDEAKAIGGIDGVDDIRPKRLNDGF